MRIRILTATVMCAVVTLLACLTACGVDEDSRTVTVESTIWQRSVGVEERRETHGAVRDKSRIPPDAWVDSIEEENVFVNDTGYGGTRYGHTEVQTVYHYTRKEWVETDRIFSEGRADEPRVWPEVVLPETTETRRGSEREAFFIVDTDGNRWPVSESAWELIRPEMKLRITFSMMTGDIRSITRLE